MMPRTSESIAADAIESIGFGEQHTRWLSALMVAIDADIARGYGRKAKDLASLGQYLADECANYLERERQRLEQELSAASNQAGE